MHNRRARPTLRLLAEDLTAGWASPRPRRLLADGDVAELHPLSELQHPIIAKATESFGPDPAEDRHHGAIAASTKLALLEIKGGQWRGGVWEDRETGVRWLLVAGLAKGEHLDHDDFYQRVGRENRHGDPRRWLPTPDDLRLLSEETAARLLTEWELAVQQQLRDALRQVERGGCARFDIPHPKRDCGRLAQLTLTVTQVREPDYQADEIDLEITPTTTYAGTKLLWQLTVRALICLSPPEQGWDRYRDTYSNIAEPGSWASRRADLDRLVTNHELAESEPGSHSHYTHREHLAGSTIEGHAVRALCGAFFVPTQDHERLPVCPPCQERHSELAGHV
ncbi:DUF3039 domain-containing protein [Parafrankia sp. FMc2]|uniref:DUF3039 domain-containing protein n=1 Tax=Parafrankia sp. FMc2 TaxID=3233196 RepID=UPI0034D4C182